MTANSQPHSGGCLCGAVRFVALGDPAGGNHCHCGMCRKDSGSAVSTFVTYPTTAVTWDGKPAEYQSSPGKFRGFCPTCGSSITWRNGANDSTIDFRLGSFDDPRPFKAHKHLWMRNALESFAGIDPDIDHID
jgi:hypothetical protein